MRCLRESVALDLRLRALYAGAVCQTSIPAVFQFLPHSAVYVCCASAVRFVRESCAQVQQTQRKRTSCGVGV